MWLRPTILSAVILTGVLTGVSNVTPMDRIIIITIITITIIIKNNENSRTIW